MYARYRDADPVHWGMSPAQSVEGSWYLFRYSDVAAAFRNPHLGHARGGAAPTESAPPSAVPSLMRYGSKFLVSMDPPDHTRLRGLVTNAFTPRMIDALRMEIAAIATDLLDRLPPSASFDLIECFAAPLPLRVVAGLLGVRIANFDQFRAWSEALAATGESSQPDIIMRAMKACEEFEKFLLEAIAEKRKHPGQDLISSLLAAEQAGERVSQEEVVATCMLLLVAGHETVTNFIGNSVLNLSRHAEQYEALRNNRALLANAVEELLRYDAPARIATRWAINDVTIGEKSIKKGQRVALVAASANHDPAEFVSPEILDLTRPSPRHLSFGGGIHFCLGAALARTEAEIALGAILDRYPRLHLKDEHPRWKSSISLRGLQSLVLS